MNDVATENDASNYRVNKNKTTTSRSFEYMTKIIERTPANNSRLNTEVVILLKNFRNFWRSLVLINCETKLDLSWSKDYVISEISGTDALEGANSADAAETIGVTFQINGVRL